MKTKFIKTPENWGTTVEKVSALKTESKDSRKERIEAKIAKLKEKFQKK